AVSVTAEPTAEQRAQVSPERTGRTDGRAIRGPLPALPPEPGHESDEPGNRAEDQQKHANSERDEECFAEPRRIVGFRRFAATHDVLGRYKFAARFGAAQQEAKEELEEVGNRREQNRE